MKSIHICFHILLIFIGASHQNSGTTSLIDTVDQGGSNLYDIKDKINNNEIENFKDDSISQNKNVLNNDYNFDIDQKEQDSLNANDASLSGENKESPSFSDANDAENSLDDDSFVTNDKKKDTDDYFRNDDETNQDTNVEDTDQADDDKSEDDQIDLKSNIKEIFTNLENGNEDANADFDEESKKIVVISIVDNQSDEQQETDDQEQQQLEQPSDDFSNNQNMENSNNQVEYSETKPLLLFKIRPIQRVFDRVLDTESDYYYKLLEMYEKNALDSEKKYYKRIYRRFGARIENDQNENDMQENGEEEETEEEGEEREGELSIDEILYRKKMLDNGENFRNEMMQIIMNKIQRIETLIISSFQLLLVLSIFLIVVQFLILLNNLMKKSKHRVYQHRLIAKAANNNQNAYSDDSYGVKSKHDILNV